MNDKLLVLEYNNGGECVINVENIIYLRYYPKNSYRAVSGKSGCDYGEGTLEVKLIDGDTVLSCDCTEKSFKKYIHKYKECLGLPVEEEEPKNIMDLPLDKPEEE